MINVISHVHVFFPNKVSPQIHVYSHFLPSFDLSSCRMYVSLTVSHCQAFILYCHLFPPPSQHRLTQALESKPFHQCLCSRHSASRFSKIHRAVEVVTHQVPPCLHLPLAMCHFTIIQNLLIRYTNLVFRKTVYCVQHCSILYFILILTGIIS